jgi:catechol 2,3-dioxygenase-like lactoylglutathione lyase family enzyme
MSIGSKKMCQLAILVRDIERALDNWAKLLGMEKPSIWIFPKPDEVPAFTNGNIGDYSDCKLAIFELDNIRLELVEPGPHSGPWKEKLERDGEGLQHLSFIVPDRKKFNEALKNIGAPVPYHIGYWPDVTYSFVNTIPQLGVELNIKTEDDNREKIKKLKENPELYEMDLE